MKKKLFKFLDIFLSNVERPKIVMLTIMFLSRARVA